MPRPKYEYDVDAEVDRRKLERAERKEAELSELNPDQFRLAKYGIDGTKIFICQVTPGVFTVKMLGKNHGATSKEKIIEIIATGLAERFGL